MCCSCWDTDSGTRKRSDGLTGVLQQWTRLAPLPDRQSRFGLSISSSGQGHTGRMAILLHTMPHEWPPSATFISMMYYCSVFSLSLSCESLLSAIMGVSAVMIAAANAPLLYYSCCSTYSPLSSISDGR